MITVEEARKMTASSNNSIAKKVDEMINGDIDRCIKEAADKGYNGIRYYFFYKDNKDPIVEKFGSVISMMLRDKLMELGWNTTIIYSARYPTQPIGISIEW